MLRTGPARKPRPGAWAWAAALLVGAAASPPAWAAEGLWDSVLERMNVKAAPPGPAPDFVQRDRPDPADLGYLPTANPHKVSALPVKSAAQIQAAKDALDAARTRQLDPGRPKPLQTAKGGKPNKPPPSPSGAD